ncbi:methionine synthase [Pseudonocardia hydrocarbonoxydans]|uniref:Methionine synthase n=1 Tax=Pseudonocardia hydrocarbonoxydans TaxID=76726 RepID=A0A4Y3WKB0_9PSEU|nr:methionine synthase [Pseudonocardia hydrocarbonoxydans]GEC19205.1 methionine synthase [Pseudonocardia hydrocarbonoxydans]
MSTDDPLAAALAAAGLAPAPPEPEDPLAAALAAAGLGGGAPPAPSRVTLVEQPEEDTGPVELPRWPDGAATGIGSMPGTDVREAAGVVAGELPLLPHLPELPARGVGADMIGRTAGLLVDIAVDVRPSGYRVAARPGRDHQRAVDLMRFDLDALQEACEPTRPGWVKVQAAGPWTLAAGVELRTGHRVLTDHGAVREFAASLTEGLRGHVAEVAARTGAQVLLQLDEPSLPAVLGARIPTPSGYGTVRGVSERAASEVLRDLIAALGVPVVLHCCADDAPLRLLGGVGAVAVSVDATRPAVSGRTAEPAALDRIGELWDAGTPLLLGLVPAVEPAGRVTSRRLAQPAFDLADRLGFDRVRLSSLCVPTPTCGLAGASPRWARRALALSRELGAAFLDPPDEDPAADAPA